MILPKLTRAHTAAEAEEEWRRRRRQRSTADTGYEVEMKVEFGSSRKKGEESGKGCRRGAEKVKQVTKRRRREVGKRVRKRGASQGEGSE